MPNFIDIVTERRHCPANHANMPVGASTDPALEHNAMFMGKAILTDLAMRSIKPVRTLTRVRIDVISTVASVLTRATSAIIDIWNELGRCIL